MRKAGLMGVAAVLAAGAAFAAAGVDQRIATMDKIEARAKVLDDMAAGRSAHDPRTAREAAAALAALAITIPQEFEANALGGKAKPAIWDNYADFTAQSDALFKAAQALDPDSAAGVTAGSKAIQATCTACHQRYKN
ncbi:cytochrome c [Paracoccus sp. p4-l81]|uniref:cytochrome c n=1 Tax=Paracoccus sp. p4-l81 TaxID=3342806 RepID=UPI0035BB37F8